MQDKLQKLLPILREIAELITKETKHFHPENNCIEGPGRVEFILQVNDLKKIGGWSSVLADLIEKYLEDCDPEEPQTEAFILPPVTKKLYFNYDEIEEVSIDE